MEKEVSDINKKYQEDKDELRLENDEVFDEDTVDKEMKKMSVEIEKIKMKKKQSKV